MALEHSLKHSWPRMCTNFQNLSSSDVLLYEIQGLMDGINRGVVF